MLLSAGRAYGTTVNGNRREEETMSEFMDEAKNLAGKNPDLANKGLDEAEKVAEEKTGGKFDSQIQQGEQKAEGALGIQDQGAQGGGQ